MSIVELTEENIESIIDENSLVVIDFGASWCSPCKQFERVFEEVSQIVKGVVFAYVDVEAQSQIAASFAIQSVPHCVIFKQGEIVYSESGSMPKSNLIDLCNNAKQLEIDGEAG